MALSPGTRLGPYEVVAFLGAGGMGEVYKARDSRLDRAVAIKILPPHLKDNPEVRERFLREAHAVAALEHPHICVLHDVGQHEGIDFLVMEHLVGETLAARLATGRLPLEQALRYAIQIADALDAAHRQGIVHRDLKPGNAMLTKQGVKLLDFGLAKLRPVGVGAAACASALPTQTTPATDRGRILGTVPYMAPEQLEGKEVDARTDIFALGAVIYEMATGRRAFEGPSEAGLIAAILQSQPPPVSCDQPLAPPALDSLVQTCLSKEPEARWSSAHDIKLQLQRTVEAKPSTDIPADITRRKQRAWRAWAAVAFSLLLGLGIGRIFFHRPLPDRPAVRLSLLPPEGMRFGDIALSPDGYRLAFVAWPAVGRPRLWLRPLETFESKPLPGGDEAYDPFWSPDSRFVAFFARDGKLKKVSVSGGWPQTLCDLPDDQFNAGATWSPDGMILFSSGHVLYRVSAAGGPAQPVTTLDPARGEQHHEQPHFLPDGHHFFYVVSSGQPQSSGIYVAQLGSEERNRILADAARPVFVPPGYLLFQRSGMVMAQPFDANRLQLTGEPIPVAPGSSLSASGTGALIFRVPRAGPEGQLLWLDRGGKQLGSVGPAGSYADLTFSPDGKRLAIARGSGEKIDIWLARGGGEKSEIWLMDLPGRTESRFTLESSIAIAPVWSPDGSRIAFAVKGPGGHADLYQKVSTGAGKHELLVKSAEDKWPADWSPDGRFLLYEENSSQGNSDLWALPLVGERKPMPVTRAESHEAEGQFSPDNRWIAYASDESGRAEVYVQAFPPSGGKWQVSTNGGRRPRWRRDGKELFYISSDAKLLAVSVKTGAAFEAGVARALFELPPSRSWHFPEYAVTNDGQRFLVRTLFPEQVSSALTVILDWTAALNR